MVELGEFTGRMRVEVLCEYDGLAKVRVDRKLGREVRYYGSAELIEYPDNEADLEYGSDGYVVGYIPVLIECDLGDCVRVRTLGYDEMEGVSDWPYEFRGEVRKRSIVKDPIVVNVIGE